MEVILIRHTQVAVEKGTCYGWSDVPVAETFETEALVTKHKLETFGTFDAVFSSPLSRARKLAEFCGYGDAVIDDRLKEMNMGDWEMRKYDDIADPYIQTWYKDYLNLPTPNGESFPIMYQRVSHFLDELKPQPFKRVAIFAHGGVLICAGIYGKLFSKEDAFNHLTNYGGIERIEI